MIVSIEGSIGTGKSTLLTELSKIMDCTIYPENLDDKFLDLLGKFNDNPERWAGQLQDHVMNMRIALMRDIHGKDGLHLIERSVISDMLFAEVMYGDKYIDAFFRDAYKNRGHRELEEHHIDLVLYLACDPAVSFRRAVERGREEESKLPIDYFEKLHLAHEIWVPMTANYHHIFYDRINYDVFPDPEEIKNVIEKRIRGTDD